MEGARDRGRAVGGMSASVAVRLAWSLWAFSVALTALSLLLLIPNLPPWFEWTGLALFTAAGTTIPVSIGIAILRYRLYDIDAIINRTLVYGSLTALVVLMYLGAVTATQAIFQTLTGQEQQPGRRSRPSRRISGTNRTSTR